MGNFFATRCCGSSAAQVVQETEHSVEIRCLSVCCNKQNSIRKKQLRAYPNSSSSLDSTGSLASGL
jgi:hypothetical protein